METANYPFLKLTLDEKFPRLLVTRRPENKTLKQNIYGAFLPKGMARRMLDLLQRIFRLHPCELDIRGDFDAPCPEYFLHRCLAPCVATICDRETYLESVEIVHLILSSQTELAAKKIERKIETLADALEYELAAEWHKAKRIVEEISTNAKWQIHAATMTDVITIRKSENGSAKEIHLATLRRGKSVGGLNFPIEKNEPDETLIHDFIRNFYQHYAPKQIYAPTDFPERKFLETELTERFGRKTKISVADAPDRLPPSVAKTQTLSALDFDYKKRRTRAEKSATLDEIKQIFDLPRPPRRVECFDVAHLAGREIVGARVVAVDGVLQAEDGLVWEFENLSETAALAAAVGERLRLLPAKKDLPDLLIVDGAKPQINQAKRILAEFNLKNLTIVGAVKPPRAHNQISHFLTASGERVAFDRRSAAMNFLQTLRDAAHRLANETHRELHSLVQIFSVNENVPRVKYLLVPTRYAERGGNAGDLSPIRSLTQGGEIILRTKNNSAKK